MLAGQGPVVAVVAVGGALGALARWAAVTVLPTPPGDAPWTTLGVNLLGCLLIGVLIALVTDAVVAHPLLRPFLGTGVLGGFTTFSGYAVDGHRLLLDGRWLAAAGYLGGTLVGAMLAAWLGLALVHRLAGVQR